MLASMLLTLALAGNAPLAAPPQQIAADIWEIPGDFLPGRGPDGNTVIFDAPRGLIVVDTGRHAWQSDAILAFARARHRPIVAIINTHWHLDHSSGNGRIKAAFPRARLYTTNAIDGALTGFLARNLTQTNAALATMDETTRAEAQLFIDVMAAPQSLKPDVAVTRSSRMRLAGRTLQVNVTNHAVTDADVWLYDTQRRVAVVGDLVTLPAPFFETACPEKWRAELDHVWAADFTLAIPGHGAPMTRDQFNVYRLAFGAFVDCAHGTAEAATCAKAWSDAVLPLMPGDQRGAGSAAGFAEYYVGFLRENGGKSPDCNAP